MDREISAEIRRLQNQIAELQRIVFGLPIRLGVGGGGGGGGITIYEAISVDALPNENISRRALARIYPDPDLAEGVDPDPDVGRWFARNADNDDWQELVIPRWYPPLEPEV